MSWLGPCSRPARHDLNRLGLPWLSCPRIPAAQCAELAALWWAADGPGLGRLRELPRPADRHLRLAQRLPECRRVRSTRLVPQGVMTEVVPRVENREKHSTKPSLRTHTTRERPFTSLPRVIPARPAALQHSGCPFGHSRIPSNVPSVRAVWTARHLRRTEGGGRLGAVGRAQVGVVIASRYATAFWYSEIVSSPSPS